MKARTWTTLSALLLIALTAVPAAAGRHRGPTPDATLYEVTENMVLDPDTGVRTALAAALQGTAKLGTPLCPAAVLVTFGGKDCTVTAIGSDVIQPAEGGALSGHLSGEFAVVVNIPHGNLVDAPELVVMVGRFSADISGNMAMPLLLEIENGSFEVTRSMFPDTLTVAEFHGTFRLPFTVGERGQFKRPQRNAPAFYLLDDGKKERVKSDEYSLGWPTVRVEVFFGPGSE